MRNRARRVALTVAGAAFAAVSAVALLRPGGGPTSMPASTPPVPSATLPSPSPTAGGNLVFRLTRVTGVGVDEGLRPSVRRSVARGVRALLTDVYTVAFVEPERWDGGQFPSLFRSFAPAARASARRDLDALSLGRTATRLTAVRPVTANLGVRVVGDADGRPVVAFATTRFRAIGMVEGARVAIRHDGAYVLRRSPAGWQITGYDVIGRVPSPGDVDGIVREARLAPAIPVGEPTFYLVIGSDARPGRSPAHALADSIHLVGVNPREEAATILGIPRDTLVNMPGVGTDKINASLARGGPDLVVRTVEQLSGVRIEGYVLTGFAGFERIVGAIGPIEIDVPYAMDDHYSHARFRAGRTELSAREALAFSRNRHDAPGGDFGRSLNQGRLLVAALAELREDLRRGDLALLPWLLAGARHLETDLELGQMVDLLLSVPAIDPDEVRNRVVPGRTATIGGRSVVLLVPDARAMFRDLARDAVLGG